MKNIIISDLNIMMGKPVIKGTRITVELILEKIVKGESMDQMLNEHPRFTKEAIQACCAFAAEALKADVIYGSLTKSVVAGSMSGYILFSLHWKKVLVIIAFLLGSGSMAFLFGPQILEGYLVRERQLEKADAIEVMAGNRDQRLPAAAHP